MTPVEFHFITPTGIPIANTPIEIQLSRSSFDETITGVLMPRLETAITDAQGKATVNLWPNALPYYVSLYDTITDAGLFYKFIVPTVAPGEVKRLQDLVIVGEMSPAYYDEAALAVIHATRAAVLGYQVAAMAAADIATTGANTSSATVVTVTALAGTAAAAAAQCTADKDQTALDRIATASAREQTDLDRAVTSADRVATAADRVITSADRAQTALDAAATALDRIHTGLDRASAGASAATAGSDAVTATISAAEAAASAAAAAVSAANAQAAAGGGVLSVNGVFGYVTITRDTVGLSNVDNTSDESKPVSTAQAAAIDLKADAASLTSHTNNTANPHAVTKAQVGLGNVDNTSDVNKPVSTAQAAADAAVLAQANTSLGVLVRNNSDAVEPTTMVAHMWWADTTTGILKLRNAGNTAWLDVLSLTTGLPIGSVTAASVDALRDVPATSITSSYTLVLSDRGKSIDFTGVGSHTVTIPANASVAFPIGSVVTITNVSNNSLSIAILNDTLHQAGTAGIGARTLAPYGVATARKTAATAWIIGGSGLT